jgi:putative ABC transport system permease protein
MALRELRASWRRLLLFFLCIALGVGGIVLLRSVVQEVRLVLAGDARALLAADVVLSTGRPWEPATRDAVEHRLSSPMVLERTESLETNTMVRPGDDRPVARMAEVRGVRAGFPLYGRVELEGGQPYTHALLANRGALVRPELLVQLEVAVGDTILIGEDRFTVRGVVLLEPGTSMGAFSFGPRVLVDADALESAGLAGAGSRVSRQILLRVRADGFDRFVSGLRDTLGNRFVRVRSYKGTEERVGEDLARAENYLSLVGLVMVILGGIGVSSVTRVFVRQKFRSIAVLKCLGATTRQIIAAYLAQAVLLGIAGCALGLLLAWAALWSLPGLLGDLLPAGGWRATLTASAVAQGVTIGLLVAVLFSLVPLLDVRRVRPSLLLRDTGEGSGGRDWVRWASMAALVAALVGIASWQAASLRVGLAVSGGLASVTLILQAAGAGLVRLLRPLTSSRRVALRHAVLRLTRPGNQTRAVLLAVGLGTFFIVGVRSLQSNLLREFSLAIDTTAADMFLIDVQPGQVAGVTAFLRERSGGTPVPPPVPVLRARVVGVQGRAINLESYEDVRGRGSLAREYTVTWRDRLEANERVLKGSFWRGGGGGDGEVSIERSLHERFRIDVGDRVEFDIIGRTVWARVTSVREVDWRDPRQGGFMFVFRPGLLDNAPATYIAPARGPADRQARARMQRDLVDRFPNVSVIDLREILESAGRVLGNLTLAVSVVGGLVLFSGALILVGSVSMTRFQRIYEAAVFRTLGASTRLLALMTALEYGVLGLLAGTIGSISAIGLAWYISRHALDIRWVPDLSIPAFGLLLTAAAVCAVGVAASADILRRRPLGALRSE